MTIANVATTNNASFSVLAIIGILLVTAVSTLVMSVLVWIFKRCCCKRSKPSRVRKYLGHYYFNKETNDSGIVRDIEKGRRKDDSDSKDTMSSIPSTITISRNEHSAEQRWDRQRFFAKNDNNCSKQEEGCSSLERPPSHARLSSQKHRSLKRNCPKKTNWNGLEDSPSPTITPSTQASSISKPESIEPRKIAWPRRTFDPSGSRLHEANEKYEHLYPNATIQFRNPINGRKQGRYFFEDGEIDLLVDFLVHVDDYVVYPRSKLTILLCANLPENRDERDELEHLEAIVADAAACGEFPLAVLLQTTKKRRKNGSNHSKKNDKKSLSYTSTGRIMVTFGSVWELPQDNPEFLKDLIV